jgi:hypothetical protein
VVASETLVDCFPWTSFVNFGPTSTVTPGPFGSWSMMWARGPSRLATSWTAGLCRSWVQIWAYKIDVPFGALPTWPTPNPMSSNPDIVRAARPERSLAL